MFEKQAEIALKLQRQISLDSKRSLVFSPTSLSLALVMCLEGAHGQTAAQISTVLAGACPSEEIRTYFTGVTKLLSQPKESFTLESANRIYVNKKFKLKDEYQKILVDSYGGQFESINFGDLSQAAQVIVFKLIFY